MGHGSGVGHVHERGVQCVVCTNFLWKEPDFVPWSLSIRRPSILPPSLPFFPLLSLAAANIACGFLMSLGMHEVREPRGRPRLCRTRTLLARTRVVGGCLPCYW